MTDEQVQKVYEVGLPVRSRMGILVNLQDQEVAALKQFTKLEDDAEAVKRAAQEFLRLSRLWELKAVSGKVEFRDNWRELEALELAETDFPQ